MARRSVELMLAIIFPSVALAAPPRRAAVAVIDGPADTEEAAGLARRVRTALGERGDLELLPESVEANLFRSPRPARHRSRANVRAAKKFLGQAETSFAKFNLAEAQRNLQKASTLLGEWVGLREVRGLDLERIQLAVQMAYTQRNDAKLKEALTEYLTRFPSDLPPATWPPDLLARRIEIKLPETTVDVRAPAGATVFLDGREMGSAPAHIENLPAGRHRVEATLADHFAADAWVDTSQVPQATVDLTLAPDLSARLRKAKAEGPLSPEIRAAVKALAPPPGLDVLVAVAARPGGKVTLARLDLASESGAQAIQADDSAQGLAIAVTHLFSPGTSPAPEASAAHGVPVWAWIGGGAGLAAVGVGVALRMMAVASFHDYQARQGAGLTQREAYQLRDRVDGQATGGAVMLGVGLSALAGLGGWLSFDALAGGGT